MFRYAALLLLAAAYASATVQFEVAPASGAVAANEFLEITVRSEPAHGNPFTRFALRGKLKTPGGQILPVDGFCDSPDGALHRIRFLAAEAGRYTYELEYDNGRESSATSGFFVAQPSGRKGLLRVDPDHPFHFQWAGTGEHYFWNGLTTYALPGWRDDGYIRKIIDRVAALKVNRLRVSLVGPRVADASRWYEPVRPSEQFHFLYGPWPAAERANLQNPRWDVTRYDTAFFRKLEAAVLHARERDVVISAIFFLDGADAGADPFGKERMFGEDARRYYRYVNARLGAYTNVTWDVSNEWHLFRNAWWVEQMGTYLKSIDPYKHLISTHGRGDFPWALSQWPDFALYQIWDEHGGYEEMAKRRQSQSATGHPFPQINEEYGYEDHYPEKWGENRRPPARSADNRRRLAWDIAMAGCYQTTGEKANRNGDGKAPATPGGWINGGFDDSMTMLEGYKKMVDFFESIPYWRLEPMPGRILAELGLRYVLYLPNGGRTSVTLEPGTYRARHYDPQTGVWKELGTISGGQWQTPETRDGADAVYLVEHR